MTVSRETLFVTAEIGSLTELDMAASTKPVTTTKTIMATDNFQVRLTDGALPLIFCDDSCPGGVGRVDKASSLDA